MNVDFQEQIDNELVPYKLPDGSVIQVRPLAMRYIILCSSNVVSRPWVLNVTSNFSPCYPGYSFVLQ